MSKELPWEYRDALGFDGLPINEDLAKSIIKDVGLDSTNDIGDTPLSLASMLGREKLVKWLLDQGALVDYVAPSTIGERALIHACDQKRLNCAIILIEAGADIETPC